MAQMIATFNPAAYDRVGEACYYSLSHQGTPHTLFLGANASHHFPNSSTPNTVFVPGVMGLRLFGKTATHLERFPGEKAPVG